MKVYFYPLLGIKKKELDTFKLYRDDKYYFKQAIKDEPDLKAFVHLMNGKISVIFCSPEGIK